MSIISLHAIMSIKYYIMTILYSFLSYGKVHFGRIALDCLW